MAKWLRFKDLAARNIVRNYQTLGRWIRERGFPEGKWLGDNTKGWPEDEIEAWLASRPKGPKPKGPRRKKGDGDADG